MNNKNEKITFDGYDKAIKRYVNKKVWQIINFVVFPGGALLINYIFTTGRTPNDFFGAFFSTFACFGLAWMYFTLTKEPESFEREEV